MRVHALRFRPHGFRSGFPHSPKGADSGLIHIWLQTLEELTVHSPPDLWLTLGPPACGLLVCCTGNGSGQGKGEAYVEAVGRAGTERPG